MKRKRIEGWAVHYVVHGCGVAFPTRKQALRLFAMYADTTARRDGRVDRIVHLVEADPAREAVVRAAVAWRKAAGSSMSTGVLLRAVERLKGKR